MVDIEEIKHKSVKGVISYALRTLALQAVGFIATVLLGYYLSPADFGIYFVVSAVIGLFTFLSDIGLAAALVQKKEEPTIEELRTTFTVQQLLSYVIFGLIVLLSPIFRAQNNLSADGVGLLYALGFSFILVSLKTIPSILLERKLAFDKLVIPQIVENLVFYSIAITLAARGFGVRSYTYAVLARSVVGVMTMYLLQRWPVGFAMAKSALTRLLKYGVKFQLNDLLARVKDDLFIIVIARFIAPAQMGYLSWSQGWAKFPYNFTVNSIMAVTFPTFSRLQDNKDKLKRAIEKSMFFVTLVIFPVLVGLTAIAFPLTEIVPRYIKWQPALPALYFFCFNVALAAISTPLTNTLNAIGMINKTLKLMVMWTLLTWTVTPLAVYYFSYNGVAIGSAVIGLTSLVPVWMVKKYIPIAFLDQIWRQAIAAFTMGIVVVIMTRRIHTSILSLAAEVGVGALIYIGVLLVLGKDKVFKELLSLRPAVGVK